ncbi:hypothetical protein COO91_09530 (plasmid) [Nostoc flagelliforme CCNUN1]|uniref:Uncharacterized protein n=1 Tax=Nostoc flagelliforme CCNUN1 TaxID=2038116 RepID=A0A2K8T8E9_9NOSO|nr:hypothetical protein COO91_09530 [Nostoc flagelliforme CCNUN1]
MVKKYILNLNEDEVGASSFGRFTSKSQSFENERKNRGFKHRESVSKHHW